MRNWLLWKWWQLVRVANNPTGAFLMRFSAPRVGSTTRHTEPCAALSGWSPRNVDCCPVGPYFQPAQCGRAGHLPVYAHRRLRGCILAQCRMVVQALPPQRQSINALAQHATHLARNRQRAARVSDATRGRLDQAELLVGGPRNMTPPSLVMLPPSKRPSTTRSPKRPTSMVWVQACAVQFGIGIPHSLVATRYQYQRATKRNAVLVYTCYREILGLVRAWGQFDQNAIVWSGADAKPRLILLRWTPLPVLEQVPACSMDDGHVCMTNGARDGNRTRTPFRIRDFKSRASTNSATRALQPGIVADADCRSYIC